MEHLTEVTTVDKDNNLKPPEETEKNNHFLRRKTLHIKADKTEKIVKIDCVIHENLTATYWG